MAKYKIKAGTHSENGRRYKEGDIVSSDLKLDQLFINKFDKVEETSKASKGVPEKGKAGADEAPLAPAKDANLDTGAGDDETSNEKPTGKKGATAGNDVTKDFDKAKEAGFTVNEVEDGFQVLDEGKVISGKEPLTSKAKVNAFIKEYVAD